MRTLIDNADLKRLFSGVSVAAVAGLLLGGAMYPKLDEDPVEGPQILMGASGARSYAQPQDAGVGVYAGRIPDHVIGTDWVRPPAERMQVLAYADRSAEDTAEVMAYEAPPEPQPAQWQDEPPPAPHYPSERGNTAYETDLPAPPEPPSYDDEPSEPA